MVIVAGRLCSYGMSYFNRSQLPYYNALIDGFTIGVRPHSALLLHRACFSEHDCGRR